MCIAYYRFNEDGSNSNPVRCVIVKCDQNNVCLFRSSQTNKELPIATSSNMLYSNSHCKVNYVEVIHDCIPRRVDLQLHFTLHEEDTKLYLQVRR